MNIEVWKNECWINEYKLFVLPTFCWRSSDHCTELVWYWLYEGNYKHISRRRLDNNFGKREYLSLGFKENIIAGKLIKSLSHFKYLGSELQETDETGMEINIRVATAGKVIQVLNFVLWSINVINKMKK